jgi:hypothetical protein
MSEVDNMVSDGFHGGVVIGTQGVENNPAGIASRIASAVNGARAQHDLDIEAEVDDTGTTIKLKQGADGFSGNSELDTESVTGVESEDFMGGRAEGWVVTPGQSIQLDFSPSRDPEGVMGSELETSGIFYRFALPNGGGVIAPTPGYEDRADGNDGADLASQWLTGVPSRSLLQLATVSAILRFE